MQQQTNMSGEGAERAQELLDLEDAQTKLREDYEMAKFAYKQAFDKRQQARAEAPELQAEVERLQHEQQRVEQQVSQYKKSQRNRLSVYGEDVGRLLTAINKETRWKNK